MRIKHPRLRRPAIPPDVHPIPRSTAPLIAPNKYAEVVQTMDEHPEIDTMDEEERGTIIDITDWRVNPGGRDRPWGRKARQNNPNNPNLNTDGMTFLRPDGLFEIYDVISGVDGSATWTGWGPYAQGENGYWWPPQPVDDHEHPAEPGPRPPDQSDAIAALEARVVALEQTVGDLQNIVEHEAVKYGHTAGLQSHNGLIVCAEEGGPSAKGQPYVLTAREGVGPWETWTIKRP